MDTIVAIDVENDRYAYMYRAMLGRWYHAFETRKTLRFAMMSHARRTSGTSGLAAAGS
jgi:hypothetical protein